MSIYLEVHTPGFNNTLEKLGLLKVWNISQVYINRYFFFLFQTSPFKLIIYLLQRNGTTKQILSLTFKLLQCSEHSPSYWIWDVKNFLCPHFLGLLFFSVITCQWCGLRLVSLTLCWWCHTGQPPELLAQKDDTEGKGRHLNSSLAGQIFFIRNLPLIDLSGDLRAENPFYFFVFFVVKTVKKPRLTQAVTWL